jgi:hypothetical protein
VLLALTAGGGIDCFSGGVTGKPACNGSTMAPAAH